MRAITEVASNVQAAVILPTALFGAKRSGGRIGRSYSSSEVVRNRLSTCLTHVTVVKQRKESFHRFFWLVTHFAVALASFFVSFMCSAFSPYWPAISPHRPLDY
ncbi:hypothetical protein Tcan_00559, partial [Toxocara canis]